MFDPSVPELSDPYVYNADFIRAVDGDTVRFRLWKHFKHKLDFGFYIVEEMSSTKSTEMNFRLYGIDTPEIRGVSLEEKERGLAAKARVEELLSSGDIRVKTYKPDKYGRWLATVWVSRMGETAINLNELLVEEGHAEVYVP